MLGLRCVCSSLAELAGRGIVVPSVEMSDGVAGVLACQSLGLRLAAPVGGLFDDRVRVGLIHEPVTIV